MQDKRNLRLLKQILTSFIFLTYYTKTIQISCIIPNCSPSNNNYNFHLTSLGGIKIGLNYFSYSKIYVTKTWDVAFSRVCLYGFLGMGTLTVSLSLCLCIHGGIFVSFVVCPSGVCHLWFIYPADLKCSVIFFLYVGNHPFHHVPQRPLCSTHYDCVSNINIQYKH